MKRMSFGLTLRAFLLGEKTVTRRLGWRTLKVGERLLAVDRVMGLRKGQKPRILGEIEIVDLRWERLRDITDHDVEREGFPGWTAPYFIEFFCREMGVRPHTQVHRIAFKIIGKQEPT